MRAIHLAQRNINDTHANIYDVGGRPTVFASTIDAVHYMDWADYCEIAELHAKVVRRVKVDGDTSWKPLQFSSITAQPGNIVRVALEGGVGNAVLDRRRQSKSGFSDGQKYGFIYLDDGEARIRAVDVQASHIDIHLDAAPSTNPTLTHAFPLGYIANLGGVTDGGGFGNIYVRDSENTYKSYSRGGDYVYSWLSPFIMEPVV